MSIDRSAYCTKVQTQTKAAYMQQHPYGTTKMHAQNVPVAAVHGGTQIATGKGVCQRVGGGSGRDVRLHHRILPTQRPKIDVVDGRHKFVAQVHGTLGNTKQVGVRSHSSGVDGCTVKHSREQRGPDGVPVFVFVLLASETNLAPS